MVEGAGGVGAGGVRGGEERVGEDLVAEFGGEEKEEWAEGLRVYEGVGGDFADAGGFGGVGGGAARAVVG